MRYWCEIVIGKGEGEIALVDKILSLTDTEIVLLFPDKSGLRISGAWFRFGEGGPRIAGQQRVGSAWKTVSARILEMVP